MLLNNKNVFRLRACSALVALSGSLALATSSALAAPAVPAIPAAVAPAAAVMAQRPADLVLLPQCSGEADAPMSLELRAGKSKFLKLSEPITRMTIGNDGIVNAKLVSPTSLYLVGTGVGSTNMILQGSKQRCTVFDVLVQFDPEPLQATIRNVLAEEQGVSVRTVSDSIVLSGVVSNAVAAQQIESLARSYAIRMARNLDTLSGGGGGSGATSISVNSGGGARTSAHNLVVNMLTVAAPQQVMLEVKVAEISKTVLDQFGINFARAYASADGSAMRFLNGLFGGQGLVAGGVSGTTNALVGGGIVQSASNNASTSALTAPVGSATIGGTSQTIPMIAGKNATTLGIEAQKQDGLVKVLAEPTVMAISGQEGSFLAGGKIFIPVAQNNGAGAVTYTLEEKEFGVSLRFRPTVLADGRINLQVNPEVSELSASGVTISSSSTGTNTILPAFTTRKASTTVQLHDGQSFAIGGLMKSNVTGNINAFPILGELPIIGALFRSTSYQTDRSELVFVITPRLVKPLPADYPLPTDHYIAPSRSEVILDGKLEGGKPAQSDPAAGGFEQR
jgi:pilus assembly protein CpaC